MLIESDVGDKRSNLYNNTDLPISIVLSVFEDRGWCIVAIGELLVI